MISLRDRIAIHTTPRQVFAWLDQMPQAYTSWHPDHVACRVLHGSMHEVGSEIVCEEILHGAHHRMRFHLSEVHPDHRVAFEIVGMGRGAFEVQATREGVWFMAELDIGSEIPVIGHLFDLIFQRFFKGRIEAMQRHMAEEGRNLKAILETGAMMPSSRAEG
jgi:hypothetical protein